MIAAAWDTPQESAFGTATAVAYVNIMDGGVYRFARNIGVLRACGFTELASAAESAEMPRIDQAIAVEVGKAAAKDPRLDGQLNQARWTLKLAVRSALQSAEHAAVLMRDTAKAQQPTNPGFSRFCEVLAASMRKQMERSPTTTPDGVTPPKE